MNDGTFPVLIEFLNKEKEADRCLKFEEKEDRWILYFHNDKTKELMKPETVRVTQTSSSPFFAN